VIFLAGGVEGMKDYPELTEHIGRYVVHYDPWQAPKGGQWLWTTADRDKAFHFRTMQEAQQFWSTSIGTRIDGKPDRPLTAYHVQILRDDQDPIPGEHSL
jgi:hypothetical protein